MEFHGEVNVYGTYSIWIGRKWTDTAWNQWKFIKNGYAKILFHEVCKLMNKQILLFLLKKKVELD